MTLAGFLLAGPLSRPAVAVSVEDLVNLKANGLSDEVLVALIETDGSVFNLSPEDVLALHRRGLSERVLLAMIATAKRRAVEIRTESVQPPPIQQSIVQRVEVHTQVERRVERRVETPVFVPVPVAVPVRHREPERPARPVYWGFGGQRRPDSWQPASERTPDRKPEARTPATKRR